MTMKLAITIHTLQPTIIFFAVILVVAGCRRSETDTVDGGDRVSGTMQTSDRMIADSTLAEGRFVGKGGQITSGTYRIDSANGSLRLVLGDDFRTDEGPDLHVVLSPAHVDDIESESAMAAEATLIVAPLSSLAGGQQYDLPSQDLSNFQSVLIHCVEFSHLYGAAPLAVR